MLVIRYLATVAMASFAACGAMSVGGANSFAGSGLSAAYAVSGQPSRFTAGHAVSYSVKVTNNGTMTWLAGGSNAFHLGIHFTSHGGGYPPSNPWSTDQRYNLPRDIAPGISATIQVSVTPPSTSETFVLEYQMVEEHIAWFAQYHDSAVSVNAAGGGTSAKCIGTSTESACVQSMLGLINGDRSRYGLAPYTLSSTQSYGYGSCVGSSGHSVDMARTGSIWHVNSGYPHASFPHDICLAYSYAGENVGEASGVSELSGLQMLNNMMMSEPHSSAACASTDNHACNILSTRFHQVGIGIYYASSAVWLTEDFVN